MSAADTVAQLKADMEAICHAYRVEAIGGRALSQAILFNDECLMRGYALLKRLQEFDAKNGGNE